MKAKLEYLGDMDARICVQCHTILNLSSNNQRSTESPIDYNDDAQQEAARQPNPNNPMEYCSVIPPYQQVNPQVGFFCSMKVLSIYWDFHEFLAINRAIGDGSS